MGTLANITKSVTNYTTSKVEHAVSTVRSLPRKAAQLPREISHIAKDAYVATDAAADREWQKAKQLKSMDLKKFVKAQPAKQAKPNNPPVKTQAPKAPSTSGQPPRAEVKPEHRLITVQVRSAKAQLPGGDLMEKAGFYHQWMDSYEGNTSAGMGNMRGVPGENGQNSPDLPLSPTRVVNHKGREFKASKLVKGIDSEAFRAWTEAGRRTGPWTPILNDCNSYVKESLHNSTPRDINLNRFEPVLRGHGFTTEDSPFKTPGSMPILYNVVIHPDGTYHKAATKY